MVALLGAVGCAGPGGAASSADSASAATEQLDLRSRILGHGFPAIFQAWTPADGHNHAPGPSTPLIAEESAIQTMARHDLVFLSLAQCGLVPNNREHEGQSDGFTPASVAKARALRAELLGANPHAVLLAEIRYHDAPGGYLPEDSPWWKRDGDGNRVAKTHGTSLRGYFMLNIADPGWQDQVATLCSAAVETGAVDGCMLDWWSRDDTTQAALARRIREKMGDRGLLLVNVNGTVPTISAPSINGIFMEGFGAPFFSDWQTAARNLQWASSHLRAPAFTAFEMWYSSGVATGPASGRNDLARMRFATTLALCNSNGYVLYSEPYPAPGHPHDWYDFWKPTLGRPIQSAGHAAPNGAYVRTFEHGMVWCNPPDHGPIGVEFPTAVVRRSTGESGTRFVIAAGDGDIFETEGAGAPESN